MIPGSGSSMQPSFELPGRYGSSAEESSSSKGKNQAKTKKKKTKHEKSKTDADHVPLASGCRDDEEDDEDDQSDDLEGLQGLLQLDGDGKPKKRPASSKASGSRKRPATSKKNKRNSQDLQVCCLVQLFWGCVLSQHWTHSKTYRRRASSGRNCRIWNSCLLHWKLRKKVTLRSAFPH